MSGLALSWSGGKDSALALQALRDAGTPPSLLLTTITEQYERVSMHGVRVDLLRAQAAAARVPLVEIWIPPACVNEVYEERMAQAFAQAPLRDADAVASGDLFLEDVRAYREQREAVLVCVDPRSLDASFAGRAYDHALLAELPPTIDPCGENGEFHTFVHAGPIFDRPIRIEVGEVIERGGYAFCDVVAIQPGSGR